MKHYNKDEARAFFELNGDLKKTSEEFEIPLRTLQDWAKKEQWRRINKEKIQNEVVKSELLKPSFAERFGAVKENLKNEIKENLSAMVQGSLENSILNSMIDKKTDEILLSAMSADFLGKTIIEAVVVAKSEMRRCLALQNPEKPDPIMIACAEKVSNTAAKAIEVLYGKDSALLKPNENGAKDLSKLSDFELLEMLNKN